MEIKGLGGEASSEEQRTRAYGLEQAFGEMGLDLIEANMGTNEIFYIRCRATGERYRLSANACRIDGGWLQITKLKGKL